MSICIYCKSATSAFNKREHVIPRSFGGFKDNFILNDKIKKDKTVCDTCNQKFGNELEVYLGRDSYEGYVERSKHVKNIKPFHRRRIVITVVEGEYKGLKVEILADNKIKPLPQIGLKNKTGCWDYLLPEEVKSISEKDYDFSGSDIRFFNISGSDAECILKSVGIPFKKIGELPYPAENAVVCDIEFNIDRIIRRAIAKIAFNYFAYHNKDKDILLNRAFDKIRQFILVGDVNFPVKIDNEAILIDEKKSAYRKLGHIVTINQNDDGMLISQISLFNYLRYTVLISEAVLDKTKLNIGFGHFFDIQNHKILKIERSHLIIPSISLVHLGLYLPKWRSFY